MPQIYANGFETGDFTECQTSGGTKSIVSSPIHTGDYALRCNPTTTGTGYARFGSNSSSSGTVSGSISSGSLTYFRFYYRYAIKPTSNDEPIAYIVDASSLAKFELRIDSLGRLVAYDSLLSLLATGATILNSDTWYCIEIECRNGTSANWSVRIDEVNEINGTANLGATDNIRFYLGRFLNRNSNTIDFFYDDVVLNSTVFPGVGGCIRLDPDGDGTYTSWTGTYVDVDDALPHDGDSSYISSNTLGQAKSVTLESASSAGIPAGSTIHSVSALAIVRDEGGSSALRIRLRSIDVNSDTLSDNDPGSSYVARVYPLTSNPYTATTWTYADLDTIEVGVVNNTSVAARCTRLAAMVYFTPALPTAPVIDAAVSNVSVASLNGGTPSNQVSLFDDIIVSDLNEDNLTATFVIVDPTKANLTSTLPSGWSQGVSGSFSATSRTPSQMTLDLQTLLLEGAAVGTTTGTLTISDGALTDELILTITVVVPDLSVEYPDNSTYDFGNINTNTPTSHIFTIFNIGAGSDVLGTLSVSGTGFSISSEDNPSGNTIASGASDTVTVIANFTTGGSKTGTLTIPSNDPSAPYLIQLTAEAIGGILYAEVGSGGGLVSGTATKNTSFGPTVSGGNKISGNADLFVTDGSGDSTYFHIGSGGILAASSAAVFTEDIFLIGAGGSFAGGSAEELFEEALRIHPYPIIRFRVNLDFSTNRGTSVTMLPQLELRLQELLIPEIGPMKHGDEFVLDGIDAIYVRHNYSKIGRSANDPQDTLEVLTIE